MSGIFELERPRLGQDAPHLVANKLPLPPLVSAIIIIIIIIITIIIIIISFAIMTSYKLSLP